MDPLRITKISLKNFRAFRGEYILNLRSTGNNLLVYGENGSGKSSLYQALDLFLHQPVSFADHKNFYIAGDDGYVKLEIGDTTNPSNVYEWEQVSHPYSESLIVDAAKTKGFLDYRSLLETHFVHRRADNINIFELLINVLLASVPNPITKRHFRDELHLIRQLAKSRKSQLRRDRLDEMIPDFNAGLQSVLSDLVGKANEILKIFEQSVTIELNLPGSGLTVSDVDKSVQNQTVSLTASFYGKPVVRHHHILNEARLSAMAISIYLSALLLNPPSQLRVMFLDDVLIGLDMSNRLPLLDILARYFNDWQIILTTFDRVWFEMVRFRVGAWQPPWSCEEFYSGRLDEGEIPIHAPNREYLASAERHLIDGDLKAAAIYIRSAYEHTIKRFCDKHYLAVRYCENPRDQKSDDFWKVVKTAKDRVGNNILDNSLVTQIELYRGAVLNQLSHTAPISLVRSEVEGARVAVVELRNRLQSMKKGDVK